MTSKEKQRYLRRYLPLNEKIDRLLDEKARWQAMAERTTTTISDILRGCGCINGDDRMAKCVDKIIMLEKRIDEETDRLIDLRDDIMLVITTVHDEWMELLLQYRYIDNYGWTEITHLIPYERTRIFELHGQALVRLDILKRAD